jgi:hypothetical protein
MDRKPIKPAAHGMTDYLMTGILMAVPALLGLPRKTTRIYQAIGAGFTLINALTDTPAGVKRVIPFKTWHKRSDQAFLAGFGLMSLIPMFRNTARTTGFQLGYLATALAYYCLTDFKAPVNSKA